jgi:predicted O-methyltransferase YrrM
VTQRLLAALRYYVRVLRLPPRVAAFYLRARRTASRQGDGFSIDSATPPNSMRRLLAVARDARRVVEIGTGTAWGAIGLALADPERQVVSYDPVARPERELYLELAGTGVRSRIELRGEPGEAGPSAGDPAPELVFVDGSHERERTVQTFRVWRDPLASGGAIAFHDYGNAAYPGVTEAIEELGLEGEVVKDLFVWRKHA